MPKPTRHGFRRIRPPAQPDITVLLTPLEAAAQLRLSPQIVKRLAREGYFLGATKIGSAGWRIPESSLPAFASSEACFISTHVKPNPAKSIGGATPSNPATRAA